MSMILALTGVLHVQHSPAALNREHVEHLVSPVEMSVQQTSSQGLPTHPWRFSRKMSSTMGVAKAIVAMVARRDSARYLIVVTIVFEWIW